jgi:hypothetical protein
MKESKGLQAGELGDQISFDQWFFRLAFSLPGLFWLCGGAHLQRVKEFGTLQAYFIAKDEQRWTAYQRVSQTISVISRCLNILTQKLS